MTLGTAVSAQGFLGKLKKAAEKVANAAQTVTNTTTTGVVQGGGQWAEAFDLSVESCEGDPSTKEVLLTLSVLPKTAEQLHLGNDNKDFAADAAGNRYALKPLNSRSLSLRPLMQGIPVRWQMLVKGVPVSENALAAASMYYYSKGEKIICSSHTGMSPLVLRNIPISWKPLPDKNVVAAPFTMKVIADVNISSCTGDKKTGNVALVLSASPKSSEVSCNLGNFGKITCFDAAGKEYKGMYAGKEYATQKTLSADIPTLWQFNIAGVGAGTSSIKLVRVDYSVRDLANDISDNSTSTELLVLKDVAIDWK